ncbi:ATP-binding cassette domain-containing protein [Bosea sp. 124]|uniref:ABC transporter ATP-binding protein n=1 Tax=Bosea sp. 124 TaxID=2135642 RepID=UPI000D4945D9|nr:ATP-binding cassette domain-containing protein [Bosea sp. 124]PTM40797.1 putative ABC transport system ATP-binding protein [Bosea sp. 124]
MPASPLPEVRALPLHLSGLTLDHRDGSARPFRVLDLPALTLQPGATLGVGGPSGCGKSSLLHLVAGLLKPTSGTVAWGDLVVSALSEGERDRWRRGTVGFVFQDFHLVPELDVAANIALPASFSSWRLSPGQKRRALELAEQMGLSDPRRRAAVLSRGEQQRVAIARALFNEPCLILADEPTASLGVDHAGAVGDLLLDAAARSGATLICASHDGGLLGRMAQRLDLGPMQAKQAAA